MRTAIHATGWSVTETLPDHAAVHDYVFGVRASLAATLTSLQSAMLALAPHLSEDGSPSDALYDTLGSLLEQAEQAFSDLQPYCRPCGLLARVPDPEPNILGLW